ncbi:hypothetical protein CKAN_02514500 [Cinnamomum micranthum f. kanehirae]|uniref:Uncharacterized protein n=1 Tax=Cinnamomum micranthum f. kanehirae TaxID=337451 RepID=A0A443PYF7_9MAGN|nr:hypothetical protein CKAN_02514500 [Cinnamomum micranthum f. kanehirae]
MKNIKVTKSPRSASSDSFDSCDLQPPAASPPLKYRKVLSKQLSMRETKLDKAWERRRIQILSKDRAELEATEENEHADGLTLPGRSLTDGDLSELKGSIELGFGFKEEDGQILCQTLPALDLYFAVNRQFSDSSKVGSPISPEATSSSSGSPKSPIVDSWKIFSAEMFFCHYCISNLLDDI